MHVDVHVDIVGRGQRQVRDMRRHPTAPAPRDTDIDSMRPGHAHARAPDDGGAGGGEGQLVGAGVQAAGRRAHRVAATTASTKRKNHT